MTRAAHASALLCLVSFVASCGDRPFDSARWIGGSPSARGRMMIDLSQSKVLFGLDEAAVLAKLGAPDQAQTRLVYHILPPNDDGVSGAWMDVVHENGKLAYIWPVGYGASKHPSPPAPSQLPWQSMSTAQRVCAMQWMLANFPSMPSSPDEFRAQFGEPTFNFVEWQYAADWGTCARTPHCYYVVRFQGGVVDSFGGND